MAKSGQTNADTRAGFKVLQSLGAGFPMSEKQVRHAVQGKTGIFPPSRLPQSHPPLIVQSDSAELIETLVSQNASKFDSDYWKVNRHKEKSEL
jgi:hypothetical protein